MSEEDSPIHDNSFLNDSEEFWDNKKNIYLFSIHHDFSLHDSDFIVKYFRMRLKIIIKCMTIIYSLILKKCI